jgi:hypothetical protein
MAKNLSAFKPGSDSKELQSLQIVVESSSFFYQASFVPCMQEKI